MPFYSAYFPYTILPIVLVGIYSLFENRLKRYHVWLWWAGCVGLLLLVGWFAFQQNSLDDFYKGYYHGGRKILRNPDVLYDETCYGFTNFPLVAYAFIPLANLPKETAGILFFLAGYVTLLPLAYWLVKFANVKGGSLFWVLGLLAFNGPLDYSIWLGNTTQLIMLFLLFAFFMYQQGWEILAGVLLGVAGLIKLPLILPSGYFFLRGRWKVVGGGIMVAGIILTLSFWLIPLSLNMLWLQKCILSMAQNPIAAYNNQSLLGFLARFFMPSHLEWDPVIPTPAFKQALAVGNFLLYLPALLILFLGRKLPPTPLLSVLEFFILLTCSLLTSPIAWTHYFVLLLIPAALYLGRIAPSIRPPMWLNLLFFTSLILLSSPVNLTRFLFERTGNLLFLSFHFMGGVLFYGFLLIVWIFLKEFELQLKNPRLSEKPVLSETEASVS